MLFWSSSASSCSRLHMAACSSASRASSFSSSVRLWLLIHRAIFSAVCCYLFTFRCSPSVPGVGGDPGGNCKTLRATVLQLHILSCFFRTYHGTAYQLINNPCAVQPLLHKISLCVECFLINNSADTPEKRESVLMPEMPTPHAKTSFC